MHDWTPKDLESRLESGGKVFLKIWKNGCGACKLSQPATTRLAEANAGVIEFGQVNADTYPEIMDIASVESLPAFFVFKGGQLKGQQLGFKGLAKLEELVKVLA